MTAMFAERAAGLDLVTFGEALAALIADDGLPLDAAGRFRRTIAGAELNVAVGLARLGHSVAYATRLGADLLGTGVSRALRGENLRVSITEDPERGTGIIVRDADRGRGRTDVAYGRTNSAGSAITTADIPWDQWRGAATLYLTGITAVLSASSTDAVHRAAHELQSSGVVVCLDPNLRRRVASPRQYADALGPLRGSVDIAIGSADELCLFAGDDDIQAASGSLLDSGVRLIVVKNGAHGSWATDGNATWTQPALPTNVADPVGAGDAFVAGLLSGLLDRHDVPSALARAAAVAMACVAVVGDIEGLPTREQLHHLDGGMDVDR